MKFSFYFFFLLLLVMGCSGIENDLDQNTLSVNSDLIYIEVPQVLVDKSNLVFNKMNSTWMLDGKLFSGVATQYSQDSVLVQKFGILEGKKQNQFKEWYDDGSLKISSHYHNGKLHGTKRSFSPDTSHILISELNYQNGKLHGVQRKWYGTGEIFKVLHLVDGKEEGIQQAFRKNGALYANYEAKEGRIFGLKRAALCFGLENENIKYAE